MAERFTLLESALQLATAQGGEIQAATVTMLQVAVDITSLQGTISDFDVWLEGSVDGGATYRPLVADRGEDAGTAFSDRINIVNNFTTGTRKSSAVYKHLACDKIRVAWLLAGSSTPGVTFGVKAGGK